MTSEFCLKSTFLKPNYIKNVQSCMKIIKLRSHIHDFNLDKFMQKLIHNSFGMAALANCSFVKTICFSILVGNVLQFIHKTVSSIVKVKGKQCTKNVVHAIQHYHDSHIHEVLVENNSSKNKKRMTLNFALKSRKKQSSREWSDLLNF